MRANSQHPNPAVESLTPLCRSVVLHLAVQDCRHFKTAGSTAELQDLEPSLHDSELVQDNAYNSRRAQPRACSA